MTRPMIVWCVIAGVLLCVFLFRAAERYFIESRHHGRKPRHVVEIGREKDIFFIPGDIDEDDDFDDISKS